MYGAVGGLAGKIKVDGQRVAVPGERRGEGGGDVREAPKLSEYEAIPPEALPHVIA